MSDTFVCVSVQSNTSCDDPVKEHYIEILDRYQDLKVVTVIEVLSPINKTTGTGRDEFFRKRNSTMQSSTHLVEIDLLRRGDRFVGFSEDQLESLGPFDYLITVNRFQPGRTQYEFIPRRLRNSLPTFGISLVAPDPDVPLDLQAALDQVYEDGSYGEKWASYFVSVAATDLEVRRTGVADTFSVQRTSSDHQSQTP